MNRSHPNHGLTVVDFLFVIFGEATAFVEPAEGALDDPAVFEHDEALGLGFPPDHLQTQEGAGALAREPVIELLCVVGAIRPDDPQPPLVPAQRVWQTKAGHHHGPARWRP